MNRPKEKALEITVKLVEAKLTNSEHNLNEESGKKVADYFQEIYNKVSEITESISKDYD